MSDVLERPAPEAAIDSDAERTPLCFIFDEEPSIRQFLSLILHGSGIDTEEFADATSFREATVGRNPDLVFIGIPLDSSEVIETVAAMGKRGYFGFVQLMSNRGAAVLEHVRGIGETHKMNMLPVLKKPFGTAAITEILRTLKLGHGATAAARIDLKDALAKNWIEFWYQPKIDLRRKQLAGVETFVRARHPQHGYLPPNTFMPGATDADILSLAERALVTVLKTGRTFAAAGVSLRFAVNIPPGALAKLPLDEIITAHRPADGWPGLLIDVAEEQIITDLPLAADLAQKLAPLNVQLALDNCGRGHSALARLRQLPFAELKLAQGVIKDCGTDRIKAPLCKTVIDLAHRFGSFAVGIGIEKAADAVALVSMGCNFGQGFLFGQPMPEERFLSLLRQRAPKSATQA